MLKIIMYDISADKPRARFARYLEREGMVRLQYSVFAGTIKASRLKAVSRHISEFFHKRCTDDDRIFMTTIDVDNFVNMEIYGKRPDLPYILNEVNVLYL